MSPFRPRRPRRACRRRWHFLGRLGIVVLTARIAVCITSAALAADPDGCAPAPGDAAAVVAGVTDDLELKLGDGRTLRLAGLDPPRATAGDPDLAAKARRALEEWLAERPAVTVRALAPAADRWNRVPALVFAGPDGAAPPGAGSAAVALLRAGLARAAPDRLVHACFPAFLAAEEAARAAKRGLWADPHYAVLSADDPHGLAEQAGGMALVEGLLRIHEARGTFYLTLGRDRWGFSAVLSRRNAERFTKAGLDVADYVGTPVRLRADLDTRFGPRMVLTDPDQMESLEPGTQLTTPDRPTRAEENAKD